VSVITFTRVGKEDTPQEWGIRGPREQLVPGSTVTACRLDGTVGEVIVGPMIRSNEKTGISIHHIQPAPPAKTKKKYWNAIPVSEKRVVINAVIAQYFQDGSPFSAEHVASKIRAGYAHLYYLTRGLTMGIGQMLASNKDFTFTSEKPPGSPLKLWRYAPLVADTLPEEQPEDEKQRIQAVIKAGVGIDLLPCRDCGVQYPAQSPWFPEATIGEDLCINCQPKTLEPAVGAKHWAEMVLYRLENYLMDKSQEARVLQADADEMKDYYKGRKVQSKEAATMLRHFRKIELELAEKQEALRQESLGRERKS